MLIIIQLPSSLVKYFWKKVEGASSTISIECFFIPVYINFYKKRLCLQNLKTHFLLWKNYSSYLCEWVQATIFVDHIIYVVCCYTFLPKIKHTIVHSQIIETNQAENGTPAIENTRMESQYFLVLIFSTSNYDNLKECSSNQVVSVELLLHQYV